MMRALRKLARRHPVLLSAFALALVATVFFAVRMAMFAAHWNDPDFLAQEPAPWMTPRYISHTWGIPPDSLRAALHMPGDLRGRATLERIAEARGVPVEEVIREVEALVSAQGHPRMPRP